MTLREIIDNGLLLEEQSEEYNEFIKEIAQKYNNEKDLEKYLINRINEETNKNIKNRLTKIKELFDNIKELRKNLKIWENEEKVQKTNFKNEILLTSKPGGTGMGIEIRLTKINKSQKSGPRGGQYEAAVYINGFTYAGSKRSDNTINEAIKNIKYASSSPENFLEKIEKPTGNLEEIKAWKNIPEEIAKKNNKKVDIKTIDEVDLGNLEKNTLYSFRYAIGAKTKYNDNNDIIANSNDINYTFNSKSIDVEIKRTYNIPKEDPFGKNNKYAPAQVSLFAILKLLKNIEKNRYSIGIYFNGFEKNSKKGKPGTLKNKVYVDNTQEGKTIVGLDDSLREQLNNIGNEYGKGDVAIIDSYKDLSEFEVKRISSMVDLEKTFLEPTIKNIEKIITVYGNVTKEKLQNEGNPKINPSVASDAYNKIKEIGKNVKKNLTIAGAAIAMGSSKLDPNYKSSQNYQQNTKIERNYNQSQEIFKAAKRSLDSIINFCKRYGLNNLLQEANRLLPLLNKKMAASVETKYFNY